VNQPVEQPTGNRYVCYRHPERRAGVTCQRCDRPICPDCMNTASVGFHCPECAKTGRQKVYTKSSMARLNRPLVTRVIIAVNVAVYVAGFVYESRNALSGRGGFALDGGLFGPSVADGEWYRLVTSGFLHAGLVHLGLNMYLLYLLGSSLEPALGRARFLAVYFTSLLCGSLGVILLQPEALTVGASGAVFGLMGALFVLARARGIDPWSSGIGSLIVVNMIFTFAIPGISIGGHVGGLAGGMASAWLLEGTRNLAGKQALGAVVALGGAAAVAAIGLA
jgi:membrane associated rhomboid family serine protease